MSSYDQVNATADAEMEQFLSGLNQPPADGHTTPPTAGAETPKAALSEDDFIVDDDDDEVGEGGNGPSKPDKPVGQQPSSPQAGVQQPQAPASMMYTPEQLEYERRLAEERGRAAAYNELIRGQGQPQQPQQPQDPAPYFSDDELNFTQEEESTFSPETRVFAGKIANRAVDRILREVVAPLQQEIAQQREQLANYGAGVAKTNSQVLYSQVQTMVPDLPQITQSQEWRTFMQQPHPLDSSVRIGDIFLGHLHNGRTQDILNVINAFKAQNPVSQNQMAMAPGQSSVGTPPTSIPDRKPKMLAYSKYLEAVEKWQRGLIPYEKYAEIEAMYSKAQLEGRIKY